MLLSLLCERHGLVPIACETVHAAWPVLKEGVAALILDLGLPDADGVGFLRDVLEDQPELPCFILTVRDSARAAVDCLKAGARDYFTKPFDPVNLFQAIRGAIRGAGGLGMARSLSGALAGGDFQWSSTAGNRVDAAAVEAARSSGPVLLTGEPGTGKSALARMIHHLGDAAQEQFRAIDAEVMKPEALQAELFGVDGRASEPPKQGLVELAGGGTLYIAAVEKLAPEVQAGLLEMLETGKFRRMHARCFVNSGCRIICGSSVDLEAEVKAGRFRKDLLFWLRAPGIHLEPLRGRIEDLPVFCEMLLTRILVRDKRPRLSLSESALQMLLKYHWPGNLDELNHALESACARCSGNQLRVRHFPDYARCSSSSLKASGEPVLGSSSIDDVERASLVAALSICKGNRRLVAERLGVSRRTIYNMIDRHKLRGVLRPQ